MRAEFLTELQRLEHDVDTVADANREIVQEVKKVATVTQLERQRFAELTQALEAQDAVEPSRLEEIRGPVSDAPVVDLQRLDRVSERLQQIRGTREGVQ